MEQRYITVRIPVIETGEHHADVEKKRRKLLEEIDEFLSEVSIGNFNNTAALAEWFDVLQTMAGLQLALAKVGLKDEFAYDRVDRVFRYANDRHLVKMENYAAARRWTVVTE